MESPINEFFSSVATAVAEAQGKIEWQTAQNFLCYFEPKEEHKQPIEELNSFIPRFVEIVVPKIAPNLEQKKINVPVVTLLNHNSVKLDYVKIKANIKSISIVDKKTFIEFGPPVKNKQEFEQSEERGEKNDVKENDSESNQIEMVFRNDAPSEGISRINLELNKLI